MYGGGPLVACVLAVLRVVLGLHRRGSRNGDAVGVLGQLVRLLLAVMRRRPRADAPAARRRTCAYMLSTKPLTIAPIAM